VEDFMIGLGVFFGFTMLVSVFLSWETYIGQENFFLIRTSEFLGVDNNSFDLLFGLHFFPILGTLLFIVFISLAKKNKSFGIIALVVSLICFVIGAYNIFETLTSEDMYNPGLGLWLYTIASLITLVISILITIKRDLLEKNLFGKLFDAEK
jgi:hypothetical protein